MKSGSKRMSTFSNVSSRPQAAPVQFGFQVQSNKQGSYAMCSFAGLRGTKVSGTQFLCNVATSVSINTGVLQNSAGTFLQGLFIRPYAVASGSTNQIGTTLTPDPLRTTSSAFTRFRFTRLRFMFVPSASTSQTTQLTMGFTPNAAAQSGDFDSQQEIEELERSVTAPVWQEAILETEGNLPMDRLFMMDSAAYNPDTDWGPNPADLTPGALVVALGGTEAASNFYGRIMMEYEIELYSKRAPPAAGPSVLSLKQIRQLDESSRRRLVGELDSKSAPRFESDRVCESKTFEPSSAPNGSVVAHNASAPQSVGGSQAAVPNGTTLQVVPGGVPVTGRWFS